MQRGSFQWMKSLNKTIILNKIRKQGPISRAQIAKETKLTPPTVGSIVKELIEQGIVRESTLGVSQGGRKPTMLVINDKEFYIIGIDAGPNDIDFVLTDLSGNILEQSTAEINKQVTNDAFVKMLKTGVQAILDKYKPLLDKIIGIGVAMHGVVDVASGTALFAPNLNLREIPIKQELEQDFDLVVKVENDARSMALGVAWFGDNQENETMVVVNIGRGIGAGIIINGRLYHGEFDLAGEIGHMTIDIEGKQCECGNHGCLQTVASGPAIADRAAEFINSNEQTLITDLIDNDLTKLTGEVVYQAALKHDQTAIRVLDETAKYIGIGLTNIVHIINPSKIVLGGGVSKSSEFILEPIKQIIATRALTSQAKQTSVVVTNLAERATVLGAVALILVELFNPNENNG